MTDSKLNQKHWSKTWIVFYDSFISTLFFVVSVKRPNDCSDLNKSTCKSWIYKIYPENTPGFKVFCEMEKHGGGWTVSCYPLCLAYVVGFFLNIKNSPTIDWIFELAKQPHYFFLLNTPNLLLPTPPPPPPPKKTPTNP